MNKLSFQILIFILCLIPNSSSEIYQSIMVIMIGTVIIFELYLTHISKKQKFLKQPDKSTIIKNKNENEFFSQLDKILSDREAYIHVIGKTTTLTLIAVEKFKFREFTNDMVIFANKNNIKIDPDFVAEYINISNDDGKEIYYSHKDYVFIKINTKQFHNFFLNLEGEQNV